MEPNDINLTMADYMGNQDKLLWEDTPDCTTWLFREAETIRIRREWKNVRAVLENNMKQANDFSRTQKMHDMQHMATIPMGLYWEWEKEGLIDDDAAMSRRLNDADFAKLRVNGWKL